MPPEHGGGEPNGQSTGDSHRRVLEALRAYSAEYTYLNRQLATWLGVHTADAAAYAEILYAQDRGKPLTPAMLARRLAMSSGAATSLLNRLETAGLIVRSRESRDRRVVTLRSDPALREQAPKFFGPLGSRLQGVADDYSPQFLDDVADFIGRLQAGLSNFIAHAEQAAPRSTLGD